MTRPLLLLTCALAASLWAAGCSSPITGTDSGVDAGPPDAPEPFDAGVDAGDAGPPITVHAGFSTADVVITTGGSLRVVGGTFRQPPACSADGTVCVSAGFAR